MKPPYKLWRKLHRMKKIARMNGVPIDIRRKDGTIRSSYKNLIPRSV